MTFHLYLKGVDYVKIDVAPSDFKHCVQYSSWQEQMNPCQIFKNGFDVIDINIVDLLFGNER